MAEGYIRLFAKDQAEVYSAGIEEHGLNPRAVLSMKEDGVDISGHFSKTLDSLQNISFDIVITVCDNAKENCPVYPGKVRVFHHNFEDPASFIGNEEETMNKFREIRDKIKSYSLEFANKVLIENRTR